MAAVRWKGTVILLLCAGLSSVWSYSVLRNAPGGVRMIDFAELYYGARCGIRQKDLYDPNQVLNEFKAEGGRFPADLPMAKSAPIVITTGVNLPTAYFLAAPFAMLPWGIAQSLWSVLTVGLLALAALVLWNLGASAAPTIWICLAGFVLANCEVQLSVGNVAGIAVGLCVLAAACFLRERYVWLGVVFLAVSLALKPHDSGFVWLYFLLAGSSLRKRALQTLAVAGILGLLASTWLASSSPHWMQELHRNLATVSASGGTSDPGLSGESSRRVAQIIDLQAPLSVLRDAPDFFSAASYITGGSVILLWALAVVGRRFSLDGARLAIAAIAPLTLLPVYHRPYDAKLLLLTIPACAMLWAGRGMRRWIALALTSAGILATSDIPLALYYASTQKLFISTTTLVGKMMAVLLFTPAPLVLLALGCFYLWVFLRYNPPQANLPLAEKDGAAADAGRAAVQVLPMQAAPPLQPEPLERL